MSEIAQEESEKQDESVKAQQSQQAEPEVQQHWAQHLRRFYAGVRLVQAYQEVEESR